MNEKEIIKAIMEEREVSNAQIAAALGISQAAMWDRLNGKKASLNITKLNEMLRYLDYELVIMPRGRAGKISGAMIVGDSK